nr:hypothetical protein A4A49_04505 [Ipomoea batatas]
MIHMKLYRYTGPPPGADVESLNPFALLSRVYNRGIPWGVAEPTMASDKLAMSETTYNDDEGGAQERHDDSDETRRPEYHLGKALAHRAIYGSRRGRGRKTRSTDNKSPPSRLSKVSSADEAENN